MRRSLVRALGALGVAVAAAAPASAATNENLVGTGTITYTWQGEPFLGCAAVALCNVVGAMTVAAQGQVDVQNLAGTIIINFGPGTPSVRVLGQPGAAGGECLDTSAQPFPESLFVRHAAGGRLVAHFEPPPSSGRCAGPLESDLAGLGIPVRKRGAGKRVSYDLRATEPLLAGPFAGRLVSTLVLRPGGGGSSTSESGGSSGSFLGPPHPSRTLFERVSVRYGVASVPDVLETAFSGEPDPFCAAVDSCGATGSVGLSFAGMQRTLTLVASRRVTKRVDAHQALADLRRGRLRIGASMLSASLNAAETFVAADGTQCQESSTNPTRLIVSPARRGTSLSLVLDTGNQFRDVVRTYCPGPAQTDVFGPGQGLLTLGRGSIGVAQLLAPQSTVTLTSPGSFSGTGYDGSRSGALGLTFTLEHVSAGTVTERAG